MKRPSIRNILVPIDFSKMSIQAIASAKRLAQGFGATVHLAHIHQFDYPAGFTAPMPPLMPFSLVSYEQETKKQLARKLKAVAMKHGLSPATCHIRNGAPVFDEVCRLAMEIPADLIVIPTHGYTGLKHVFLGSTAERIVQHSPCPVFIARPNARPLKNGAAVRMSTILVPVDFSGCSLKGLKYAIGFAYKFAAKIILLHAIDPGYAYTGDVYAIYDPSELMRLARKEAADQMGQFVLAAKFGGVKFETLITTGPAVQEICAFAQRCAVDLIIMSTHGRTGLDHVLMGSVAENVVRRAPSPVLTVQSYPHARQTMRRRQLATAAKPAPRAVMATAPQALLERKKFTRKYRNLTAHAFPERRRVNKFRESHARMRTVAGTSWK